MPASQNKKRQYEIVNNSTGAPVTSLNVDGHEVKLQGNGMATVVDEGLAKEIDARYGFRSRERTGGKVVVVPIDDRDPHQDRGFAVYHRITRAMRYRTLAEKQAAEGGAE
jgi:hypothetical protein